MQTRHDAPPHAHTAPDEPTDALTLHAGNQTYPLQPDQAPLTIGRDPAANICIDDERISRTHLQLEHTTTGWVAIDRSRNGLFLNGTRHSEIPITRTTTIHLGSPHGIPITFIENTPPTPNPDDDDDESVLDTIDPNVARVGAAVAARRKELDLSQRHLASMRIMSASALIDFEKGRRWPRRTTRNKLEEALRWPAGHITTLLTRRGDVTGDSPAASITNTVQIPLMTEIAEAALSNLTSSIESLPATSDPEFVVRAAPILAGLRRIEGPAARAVCTAPGDPSAAVALGAVRKTYKDLMLRAAQAPGATLGQQVFAARHRNELSVEEIAAAAGVPVQAITDAEAEAVLDGPTVAALTAALEALREPASAGTRLSSPRR
ncbi:MAG: FHA domain-containing protein [Mycobacterium sp.]|nr:FHA domain-containing protein [Mycobacterium sp.]